MRTNALLPALLGLALIAPGCLSRSAPTPAGGVLELPLTMEGPRPVVPVAIEGAGELHFILDTAAGTTLIAPEVRDRLVLDPAAVRHDSIIGASGVTVLETVQLPALHLGEHRIAQLRVVVIDMTPFGERDGRPLDGILGADVLRHFDVDLDLAAGALRLHPRDGGLAALLARTGTPVPFTSETQPGFVEFEVTLSGRTARAVLDTGAPASILNWRAATLADIDRDSPGLRHRESGSSGLDGQRAETFLHPIGTLRVGSTPIPESEMRIADLSVFAALGIADRPALLIGADLLQNCRVGISYSTSTLFVCP